MSAATASISTPETRNDVFTDMPVAASTIVYVGTMAAVDASGNVNPAADTAGLHVLGRCDGTPRTTDSASGGASALVGSDGNNSAGSAGAVTVDIKQGIFRWNNKSGNLITKAMIGQPCYVYDDNTVGIAGGTSHSIVAGIVWDVDSTGVWVDTRRQGARLALATQTQDTLTDSSGGTASTTIAAIAAGSSYAQADLVALKNAVATFAAENAKIKTDIAAILAALG